ncbi:hypothetical protein J2P12_00070 [Candidatus Bathyarchaeota archaeon]|nr:hypothetical protein [Candidatus Bathyarchaeota archaeon]
MPTGKKIIWVSRHAPLKSQISELERLFPKHTLVIEKRPFSSAEQIVKRFREAEGDEMVVVAPWSVMRQIIKLGIRPIYAEMKPTTSADAESVIVSGRKKRRYYKFVGFSYCTDVSLKLEPIDTRNPTVLLNPDGSIKSIVKS